jgi:hypothetical protein
MVNDLEQSQGMKSGFDQLFSEEPDKLNDAANKDLREQAMDAAQITGQDPNKILENARQPIQISLVDENALKVTLDAQEDKSFGEIIAEVKRLRAERDQAMIDRLQEQQGIETANQQQGLAASVQNQTP